MKKIKCVQFSEKVVYMEDNFNMIASLLVTVLTYSEFKLPDFAHM